VPKVTQIMIDDYIPGGEKEQLWHVGLLMIAFLIGKSLFQLTRDLAMLRIEGKMEGSLQSAVWERLLSLPASFFKDYTSGELAMRAFGISQIRQMVSGVFVSTLITGVFSLVYLFQVHAYGGELLKPAVVMLLILLVFGYVFGRIQNKTEKAYLTLTNRISGLVLQLFNAIAKFRVAGAENRAFKQWADLFTHARRLNFQKEIITVILNTILAIAPLVFSLVFYVKAVEIGADLQVGEFVAFTTAFGALSEGMMGIIRTILQINSVKPLYELSKPILETLPEYDEQKMNPGKLQGNIRVSHLNFRYDEDGPAVLHDISLEIKKGEYVALVGPSGCGKSTLFRLLLGFETPETGQVYYDDKDIGLVDVKNVRRQLGVVLQNGQLMSGDIFTNIIGANTKLTMEDATRAAEMAGLSEDIARMPMGMHTVVAEGAGTLSGGQKQRILIARAIVHRPNILYLDEATSALDNRTQKKVSNSLKELDCTRVVIAQRLSTVVDCDRIVVMESGRIVETGSYQELMRKKGLFADLAQRQLA
jgi:ATP-binding cassette subfamily C protein